MATLNEKAVFEAIGILNFVKRYLGGEYQQFLGTIYPVGTVMKNDPETNVEVPVENVAYGIRYQFNLETVDLDSMIEVFEKISAYLSLGRSINEFFDSLDLTSGGTGAEYTFSTEPTPIETDTTETDGGASGDQPA